MRVRLLFKMAIIASTICIVSASCEYHCKKKKKDIPIVTENVTSKVYFTQEITPEALVKIYEALGKTANGNVAVKISTGELGGNNYLKPDLIKQLVNKVNGTIVECNTAYEGNRNTSDKHWKTIKAHGFLDIAKVDIMDEDGDMIIPVQDTTRLKYNLVGSHLQKYDFMINLAHFKGHAMAGFGGVLKNQSIGIASARGKAYIHTAGKTTQVEEMWNNLPTMWDKSPENNISFIEAMATAAQSIHTYFGNGERIIYIIVMNNISIDCDCDAHPASPQIKDIGIAASLDPVALDKFCLDKIIATPSTNEENKQSLLNRINIRNGMRIIEYGEQIGLGSCKYEVINIDK